LLPCILDRVAHLFGLRYLGARMTMSMISCY
jgi:hypothetical protein